MKKIFFITILLIGFVISSFAIAYPSVPSVYSTLVQNGAITTYKHNTDNVYAIVVDVANADFNFGGNVGYYSNDAYYKGSITEHWNTNSNSDSAVAVNGQFFDILGVSYKYFLPNPARLIYPVKSNYSIISSEIYDNNFSLRSLIVNSSNNVYIRDGFSEILFNSSNIKEYMVGLYPYAVKDPNTNTGRNYIGGIPETGCNPNNNTCEHDYLIFFIATNKTHYDMLYQMSLWNIPSKSRIMMDGSGSAKMYLYTDEGPTVLNGDLRLIPNSIIINNN